MKPTRAASMAACEIALLGRQRLDRDVLGQALAQPHRRAVVVAADGHMGQLVADQPVPGPAALVEQPRVQHEPGRGQARCLAARRGTGKATPSSARRVAPGQVGIVAR